MKHFTLLFSLLLCASGATAQVKKPAKQVMPAPIRKALKAKHAAEAEAAKLWKPRHEEHFICMEEEWMSDGATTFTYDLAGNVLTETMDFDGELERTTYTYNGNNKKTSALKEYFDAEEEVWISDTRTTYTYDTVLPDFMTSRIEYKWDDVDEKWVNNNMKQSQRRTITRDAKGNITSVELEAYYSYTDSWDIVQRTDITYDPATGRAVAFDFRIPELGPDETLVYGDPVRYKNIEWNTTDGQIVAEDLTECVFGANRFKSADLYDVEGGEETLESHITVEYADGKEDFVLTETTEEGEKAIGKYTITDANGSIFMTNAYYMENELMETEYSTTEYDAQGNITLEEEGVLVSDDEREIFGGARYTNSYDDETGVLTEVLVEEYMFDEPEEETEEEEEPTGSYQPTEKFVYSDYYDVITAINRVSGEESGEAATLYNLQGVAVGRDAANLPAGLYIMKQGGRVQKVLRK